MGSGGIAKVLKDEANRKGSSSNIEVDHDGFLVANYEFARLNDKNTVYTVLPAQRADKAPKKYVRTQPYRRPETRSQAKKHAGNTKTNEECEAEKQGESKEKMAEIPIRKFLPRLLAPPRQDIDVEMRIPPDLVKTTPVEKISEAKDDQTTKTANGKSKTKHNVTFEDVEIIDEANKDKLAGKPKRALPAFKFASAVQESVNQDKFLEHVLDEPVTITFRELLSSYEVSKRIQSITKSQKILINGAKEQASTGSTAKRISNATIEDYYSSSDKLEDTATTTDARITRIGNLDVEQDFPCVEDAHEPGIFNVRVQSDTDSVSTEEEAESYYRKMREDEFYLEHGYLPNKEIPLENERELNLSTSGVPKPLAMVTSRLVGIVGDKLQVNMLLDTGAELNIMNLKIQEEAGLPMDPSGAKWSLTGVSGHSVELVGYVEMSHSKSEDFHSNITFSLQEAQLAIRI